MVTFAGDGVAGISGDGGQAKAAHLWAPTKVAADQFGNIYVAEEGSNRIRKITPTGIISTLTSLRPPSAYQVYSPYGIAVDRLGNVYVADTYDSRVRKISPSGGITVVAGTGTLGFSGDGGPATNAQLSNPLDVDLDSEGNIYIADGGRIRRVSSGGIITTVAGNGSTGQFVGDNGLATGETISATGLALDSTGTLYLADAFHHRVYRVSSNGSITVAAGTGAQGYAGDGGLGTDAQLFNPGDLAIDKDGNIYVADWSNDAIRLLQPSAIAGVANGASNLTGPIAPGEIVVLYGMGLGPNSLVKAVVGSNGLYPLELAGTQVQFNGIAAPMIYSWTSQISCVVPYGITNGTAQVTASYQGQIVATFSVPVVSAAPGIFSLDSSGRGQAAAINQDGFTINTGANPANIGEIISLFVTGGGQTTPNGIDGKPTALPPPQQNLPVNVVIGGQTVKPQYAGGTPGQIAGLMQINVQVPSGIQAGDAVPVSIQIGSAPSQPGVTLAIR